MTTIFDPSLSNTPNKKTVSTPGSAEFATDLLKRGQALTSAQMPAYTGKLTTGPSDLQEQAWKGISTLTVPTNITAAGTEAGSIGDQLRGTTYKPGTITGSDFDSAAAQKYMNPYIEAALNPQLEALRKAAKIAENDQLGKLAVSGALGGTKEAQLQALNRENLFKQQQGILGTGYANAYDKAAQQFNTDQTRNIDVQKENEKYAQFAAKFGVDALNDALKAQESRARIGADEAKYGLANLEALSKAGATKQELEQAAVNADYNEYLRQLKYPQEMLKLQKDLIQGTDLGKTTTEYGQKPSTMDQIKGGVKSAAGIIDAMGGSDNIMQGLKKMGVPVDDAVRYLKNLIPGGNQISDSQIKDYYDQWKGGESTEDFLSRFTRDNVEPDTYIPGVDYTGDYGEDFSLA
jgi:hypothetical protein